MIFDRGAVAPGVDAGYVGEGDKAALPGTIFQENIGSQPFMKVNRNGVRFANESTPYDFAFSGFVIGALVRPSLIHI